MNKGRIHLTLTLALLCILTSMARAVRPYETMGAVLGAPPPTTQAQFQAAADTLRTWIDFVEAMHKGPMGEAYGTGLGTVTPLYVSTPCAEYINFLKNRLQQLEASAQRAEEEGGTLYPPHMHRHVPPKLITDKPAKAPPRRPSSRDLRTWQPGATQSTHDATLR